jgi:predicted nuclease of predicted toxin-antitoxin system
MNVLLDENLPQQFRSRFTDHEVHTVTRMEWAGTSNGELLDLAEAHGFDVFITADQSLQYQQNLTKRNIAFVVLATRDNRIESLDPLVPAILETLNSVHPGEVVVISTETPHARPTDLI